MIEAKPPHNRTPAWAFFDVENRDTIRTDATKTDCFLKSKDHVFRVRFENELPAASKTSAWEDLVVLASVGSLYLTHEKVHKSGLYCRMQMDFRLFDQ